MYYTDLSGKVMSFNYANVPNNNPIPGTTGIFMNYTYLYIKIYLNMWK